jgi:two-component system, response regulator RegA
MSSDEGVKGVASTRGQAGTRSIRGSPARESTRTTEDVEEGRTGPVAGRTVTAPKLVYVIDRKCLARTALVEAFARRGTEVVVEESIEAVVPFLRSRSADIVVTDVELAGKSLLPLIGQIRWLQPQGEICVCTTLGSVRTAVAAMRAGATQFLIKPVSADQILQSLGRRAAEDGVEQPSYHRAVWEYLKQCVELAGSMSEAARRLGLAPRSLRRMLQRVPPRR